MKYDFETLDLIRRTGLFAGDMREFMMERDYPIDFVIAMTGSEAVRENDLIKLWHSYGRKGAYAELFNRWIEDTLDSWVESSHRQLNYLENEWKLSPHSNPEQQEVDRQRTIEMHKSTIAKYGDRK